MLNVSVRQFRVACLIGLVTLLLFQLPAFGLVGFTKYVTTLRMYKYYGALAPAWVFWAYSIVAFTLLIVGLLGMLNFWRFSRWCLVVALAIALVLRPFFGMMVYSAWEAFFGSVFSLIFAWLTTVSFWTPIAHRFGAKPES